MKNLIKLVFTGLLFFASTYLPYAAAEKQLLQQSTQYVCPMHPHIISDKVGSCPICGMHLQQVHQHDDSPPSPLQSKSPSTKIMVSGHMQQALAIRTAPVEKGNMQKQIQTLGQVTFDESKIYHIHAKVDAWAESLAVQSEGDYIKKGQLIYELYSPELINAQDDYLLALNTKNQENFQELVKRAAFRLELLGMSPSQIKLLAKTGKTLYRVPFYATQSGIVKRLNIRQGMYIQPQTEVMSIVDLSKVWVIADVFEHSQNWLTLNQEAQVSVPSLNINKLKGRVDYIYPELDPITRSLKVRVIIDNPEAKLRPNTLVEVTFFGDASKQTLMIPREALIQTGKHNRVIIKLDDDSFTVKDVTVGMQTQNKVEIVSGLKLHQRVVTSGQFLLDSEASLRSGLKRIDGHQH